MDTSHQTQMLENKVTSSQHFSRSMSLGRGQAESLPMQREGGCWLRLPCLPGSPSALCARTRQPSLCGALAGLSVPKGRVAFFLSMPWRACEGLTPDNQISHARYTFESQMIQMTLSTMLRAGP